MKILCVALSLACSVAHGQNSFPSSGNVKIFALDASWAEGIAIVKPAGWSGIRLTRNDPAGGNYLGNWAIGYNGSSGNDFDLSTQNGSGFYQGVFHISNSTLGVGIGTLSPGPYTKLNVVGGAVEISTAAHQADASLHISTSFGQFGRLTQINPSAVNSPALNIMASLDAGGNANWWSWGVLTSGSWALQPSTSFGGTTGLFLDRNGNMGIGNTAPDAKLSVTGQVHATEVKVTTTVPGPDYVFDQSYDLRALSDVKSFIDQNKHLPEVPSAAEMAKNGIQLGEMNMLLLKKIEELTLYVLQQQKQIDELNQAIKKK